MNILQAILDRIYWATLGAVAVLVLYIIGFIHPDRAFKVLEGTDKD